MVLQCQPTALPRLEAALSWKDTAHVSRADEILERSLLDDFPCRGRLQARPARECRAISPSSSLALIKDTR